MPRTVPDVPIPQLKEPGLETWTLQLKTITPMFGGSATPREVDTDNPIRAASVRGHLRFWWRATAGAGYSSPQKLFEAEEEIWGGAERQGKVAIRVADIQTGSSVRPSQIVPDQGTAQSGPMERYFLHPFNENRSENQPEASGMSDVAFKLYLHLGKLSGKELEGIRLALRAWITFGGVGARTRRGLGTLEVTDKNRADWLPSNPQQLNNWFGTNTSRDVYTILAGARAYFAAPARASRSLDSSHTAWRELGKFWTRFRKGHFTDRNPAYQPMRGSSWEDHRKLQNLLIQDTNIELVKPFLGLPIVYQKFRNSDAFAGTLNAVAKYGKRMASPVILKPVMFADGVVRPMVLILNTPSPTHIKIKTQELELHMPEHDRVLSALGARDALEAVEKAAKKCDFTEEVRL